MSSISPSRIEIPSRLTKKLSGFRYALLEHFVRDALTVAVFGLLVGTVFIGIIDRFFETPVWARVLIGAVLAIAVLASLAQIVVAAWRCRSPMKTARVISDREPAIGDHLIGALELAVSKSEQARSSSLCVAALDQVADEAARHDFHDALPDSRRPVLIRASILIAALMAVVALASPQLVSNAVSRLINPTSSLPRYTFAKIEPLPDAMVVPRDESTDWNVVADATSRWIPSSASLQVGRRSLSAPVTIPSRESVQKRPTEYRFDLPGLIEPVDTRLRVGDAVANVRLVPKLRPEATKMTATIGLPPYLAEVLSPSELSQPISGNVIEALRGSSIAIEVETSSLLSGASVDGKTAAVSGDRFSAVIADQDDQESRGVEVAWVDQDGLRSRGPLRLDVVRMTDLPPVVSAQSGPIPVQVLDGQSIPFEIQASDDYRVRRVGMHWSVRENSESEPIDGQRVLGSSELLSAMFQATALGIPTGEVTLRFWVEDDYPGRERVFSEPVRFSVLTAQEHAVWIADQFAKWRQAAMDVHDRELGLFERNRDLAATRSEDRDEDWRLAVAAQARAEEFNGRQLESLAEQGEALLRQAARNEEVSTEYVEQLADAIRSLESMADDRMPRVAALLKQAAEEDEKRSKFAELNDQESSQGQLPDPPTDTKDASETGKDSTEEPERVGLAGTTIIDTSDRKPSEEDPEQPDAVETAVEDQAELVQEFKAVAQELKELLGNMEGSTLVKRLKSVSRLQDRVAAQLGRTIEATFGVSATTNESQLASVAADIAESSARVRTVLDDLEALCERREIEHYADVLAEMKQSKVMDDLQSLKETLASHPGVSIAKSEYWADTTDRWADDLVNPGTGEPDPDEKESKSLSPQIVLEVLRVLEREVNLREQTRIAEQGRPAMSAGDYSSEAIRLSEAQDLVRDRLDQVIDGIRDLPDGMLHFSSEVEVLGAASDAMQDATKILISPETGPPAIAAQTEAIELLLQSNKVSPDSGGGGGNSAGGGEGGDTDQAAVRLLVRGLDELATSRKSETELSVGRTRADVPERWREGLQEYFELLDRRRSQDEGRSR